MMKKNHLEPLFLEIDKILSGESIIPSEYRHSGEEYQELLFLAQMLAKTNYAIENEGVMERIWSNIHNNGEMEDGDLDMVAGGVHGNVISDEMNPKPKKNGI